MAYSFGDILYFECKLLFRLPFFRFIFEKLYRMRPALNFALINDFFPLFILLTQQKRKRVQGGTQKFIKREGEGENGFHQISLEGGGEDLFLEINILSAKLGYVRVTITKIIAETPV